MKKYQGTHTRAHSQSHTHTHTETTQVFGSDGWITGISRRPAIHLQPLTCYRNAILGSTAAHSLWYLNNDASFDVSHFAREFLFNYMQIRSKTNVQKATDMHSSENHLRVEFNHLVARNRSVFKACRPSMQTVMIVKSVKLRARYVAGSGASVGLCACVFVSKSNPPGYSEEQYADIQDAWSSESVLEVASQISGDGDACVKVKILRSVWRFVTLLLILNWMFMVMMHFAIFNRLWS